MTTDTPSPDTGNDPAIQHQNRMVLVFVSVLIVLTLWMVDKYGDFIKREKCIESHRRNCDPIDLHAPQ